MIDDPAVLSSLNQIMCAGEPTDVALIAGDQRFTFADLRAAVDGAAHELTLPQRSIVLVQGATSIELVVGYLAVSLAGHVPLLAGEHPDRLAAAWHPGAVLTAQPGHWSVERTRHVQPDLHPDLALLMSTSGSTGSPKLVRLSHRNVSSNAHAIGEYLHITPADRGITTLPLHYCYGLSVLHAHLAAGAGVVLSDASVVDPSVRAALVDHAVTNVAGVPHTFELAERAGPERLATPAMRFLTVAGGRMSPEAVERWAARAEQWDVDLYVMYGQTEATARMAYLPPALARACPGAIGVPIPGGELRVDAPPGESGELVYRGDNVMMGYAAEPGDLALGATLTELRTGDLGRYDERHGVFHVVGRMSRFVKPFGLRIDLDGLEADLRSELGLVSAAVAGDDTVIAVVAPDADEEEVTRWLVARTKLPTAHIGVATTCPIPRTRSGKVDTSAVLASVGRAEPSDDPVVDDVEASVSRTFAVVLGRDRVGPDDTFVSLGGDSLGYVECSIRLERAIGRLPADWHVLTVRELDDIRHSIDRNGQRRRWWQSAQVDTTVPLRAIGICTIVATHMRVTFVPGGAHLLLAVVGYNMSRFLLPVAGNRDRASAGLRTVARAAVPVLVWVSVGMALFGAYSVPTLLLVNNYVGPGDHTRDLWDFWFVEAFVHLVLIAIAVMSVPTVRRAERRWPYGAALVALGVALVFRYRLIEILGPSDLRFRTHGVAFFFVLGWLAHRSRTLMQRSVSTAIIAVVVIDFFNMPEREIYVVAGLVVLVWWREMPLPRVIVPVVALVSTASLYILITHFTVWPQLVDLVGLELAYPLTIAAGVAAWAFVRASSALLGPRVRRAFQRAHTVWEPRPESLGSPNARAFRSSS